MAVEYSGYAGPFYCFFLWLIWWGEAPERPSTYTRAKDIFDGERTRLGQTPCRAAVYRVDCVWNAWHVKEIRLRLRQQEDAEIRGAKSYPGTARRAFDLLSPPRRRIAVGAGKIPGSFGSLARPPYDARLQVFPDNFLARALTAQGGTNASTLPPRRAISFTILELR